jgi:hypothetical protein
VCIGDNRFRQHDGQTVLTDMQEWLENVLVAIVGCVIVAAIVAMSIHKP